METQTITTELKANAILRLNENTPRIAKCLAQLSENETWHKPNENLNSIGNLILHLCGNITQYIISSIGGEEDKRQRDEEFELTGKFTKVELLNKISSTIKQASTIIDSMTDADLMKVKSVQGFTFTGMANIIHVVEHYSYHTGQIAFLTKLLKNTDLSFYGDMDLNTKNQQA